MLGQGQAKFLLPDVFRGVCHVHTSRTMQMPVAQLSHGAMDTKLQSAELQVPA